MRWSVWNFRGLQFLNTECVIKMRKYNIISTGGDSNTTEYCCKQQKQG